MYLQTDRGEGGLSIYTGCHVGNVSKIFVESYGMSALFTEIRTFWNIFLKQKIRMDLYFRFGLTTVFKTIKYMKA